MRTDPNKKRERVYSFYDLRRLLEWLLMASRGGETRTKIIELLKERPRNTNQLSEGLGVEWGTINHHLKILEEHGIIYSRGEKYGKVFFTSRILEDNYDKLSHIFNLRIKENGDKKNGKED